MMNTGLRYAVLLAIPLAACGGDNLSNTGKPNGVDVPKRKVALTVETPHDITMGLLDSADIVAKVTYVDDGTPASGRPVKFQIVGNGGGSEIQGSVTTNADGRAANELLSDENRATFKVVVSTAQAEGQGDDPEVEIDVEIDGTYRGLLKVTYQYNEPVVISSIVTRAHPGSLNCDGITWPTQPPSTIPQQIASGPSDTSVVFESLVEGQVYTVTASALGLDGQQKAVGCKVAPAIIGRGVVTVQVPLKLRPVQVEGDYDFGAELQISGALPDNIEEPLLELEQLFTNPADYLGAMITQAIADELGMTFNQVDAAFEVAGFIDDDEDGEVVDDLIENEILDRAPAWLDDGFIIGADVLSLMNHLSVGGKMQIGEAIPAGTNAYDLAGHWDWNDFMFQWRLGECDVENTCCGRRVFSGEEMGLDPMGGDFEGHIARNTTVTTRLEYDLTIAEHDLELQYGDMILFLIEGVMLPELTGQPTIECSVESMFGCNGTGNSFECVASSTPAGSNPNLQAGNECGCGRLGAAIQGWVGDDLDIGASLGNSICQLAVGGLADFMRNTLEGLTADVTLTMSADGVFADADKNLRLDVIDADLAGSIVGEAFPGTMLGDIEREVCTADAACEDYESCQIKADLLNDCAGRTVCVQRVGAKEGGMSCTGDSQCMSGECMANGKCLELCNSDDDCAGTLNCNANVDVPVSSEITVEVDACGT